MTYFHSFGLEHIPKEIKTFINNKDIMANIFRIQAYDSVMWRYFSIGFINYTFKSKSLIDSNNFKNNDDIILNYFLNKH